MDIVEEILEVNYLGTVSLTSCVLPHMMKRKQGKIVVMNSIGGILPVPLCSAYVASKHALRVRLLNPTPLALPTMRTGDLSISGWGQPGRCGTEGPHKEKNFERNAPVNDQKYLSCTCLLLSRFPTCACMMLHSEVNPGKTDYFCSSRHIRPIAWALSPPYFQVYLWGNSLLAGLTLDAWLLNDWSWTPYSS